jgi:peptide/nickel transport system permease protein
MLTYIIRRLIHVVFVVFLVLTVVFFLTRLTGDPVHFFVPMDTARADLEEIRERYGFNDPLWVQYIRFMGDAVRGDFGESLRQRDSATELVLSRVPATLQLGAAAMGLSILVGVPLGIFSAINRGSLGDKAATLISVLGLSVPAFLMGLLLILFFSVYLGWLPTSGRGSIQHLIMPTVTLAAFSVARYARLSRSTMLDVLGQDYIRTGRAKGLSESKVVWIHALKNASIPLLTITGLQAGHLLGGSVIVEQIFAWPGMGRLLVQSLLNRDFPVVMAAIVFVALVYTLFSLLTDLAYAWANPEVRLK